MSININKLETKEEFEKLKARDVIIVKWSDMIVKCNPSFSKIMAYSIKQIGKNSLVYLNEHGICFDFSVERDCSLFEEVYLVGEDNEIC